MTFQQTALALAPYIPNAEALLDATAAVLETWKPPLPPPSKTVHDYMEAFAIAIMAAQHGSGRINTVRALRGQGLSLQHSIDLVDWAKHMVAEGRF